MLAAVFCRDAKQKTMDIKLRTRDSIAELTIETGSAKITEDLATYNKAIGGWVVPENEIENFITLANELSRFNDTSDVDFCLNIIKSFLNDAEKDELIDALGVSANGS